ncbi:hypothetical protein, partial [Chromobacterium subtsugae]
AIDQQGLEGKLTDSEQLTRLAWQNISAVQKNEIDGVKTAGLILLLSGATFAIGKAFLSMFPG